MSITFTREKLFAEVWRRPIGHLARSLGVTTMQLREACKTMSIPLPDVAHWARVRAGIVSPTPELPAHDGPNQVGDGYLCDRAYDWDSIFKQPANLLSPEDVVLLTGRKWVRLQRQQLGLMKIPYALSAGGEVLVPIAAIEGPRKQALDEVAALNRKHAQINATSRLNAKSRK